MANRPTRSRSKATEPAAPTRPSPAVRPAWIKVSDVQSREDKYRGEIDGSDIAEALRRHAPMLQAPLVRRREDGGYEVVDGARRLAAAKELGIQDLLTVVVEADDATAERYFLTANLARQSLASEREARARLAELEEARATVKHGGDRRSKEFAATKRHGGVLVSASKAAADASGRSKRTVQRDRKIGRAVPEVRRALDERRITMNEADRLAGRPAEQQPAELARLLEERGRLSKPIMNLVDHLHRARRITEERGWDSGLPLHTAQELVRTTDAISAAIKNSRPLRERRRAQAARDRGEHGKEEGSVCQPGRSIVQSEAGPRGA